MADSLAGSANGSAPWKILVADDDQDVHVATRLALRDIVFRGRSLQFVDAYSGAETLTRLRENPDTAVIFLDVIMETDDAGLGAVRRIRAEGFSLPRIIVRTGHPGQAPERDVIVHYDIHDYKEKSGLSIQKLFTSLISALRAYDDMVALERHRRGLLSVLEAVSWFDFDNVQRYLAGMLAEFSSLARLDARRLLIVARRVGDVLASAKVVASQGDWDTTDEAVPPSMIGLVEASLRAEEGQEGLEAATLFVSGHGYDLVALVEGRQGFAHADRVLLEVFMVKVCQALDNHRTFQNVSGERDALLLGLALAAERWDPEAAQSLPRLGRLCRDLAERLATMLVFPDEIDAAFQRDIASAALLHDIGNLVIPHEFLARPGPLSDDERAMLRGHVAAGLRLLEPCRQIAGGGVIPLAAAIVTSHHECFDGSGYPHGLTGEAIPLAGRLVAIVDAWVAMTSGRPYRPAIGYSDAVAAISAGAGSCFDPRIVEAFLQVIEGEAP